MLTSSSFMFKKNDGRGRLCGTSGAQQILRQEQPWQQWQGWWSSYWCHQLLARLVFVVEFDVMFCFRELYDAAEHEETRSA